MPRSPLDRHGSSPADLSARRDADVAGLPYIVYRDAERCQVIYVLGQDAERVTIGRSPRSRMAVGWDPGVSWTHVQIEHMGDDWVLVDDGLSRNGTWVDGERVSGRRRLEHGNLIRVGSTVLAFQAPSPTGNEDAVRLTTQSADVPPSISAAQSRVLRALCQPYVLAGRAYPATNREIAEELYLSVVTVKAHLRALSDLFGVDQLPQNQKRAELMHRALDMGVVKHLDYE